MMPAGNAKNAIPMMEATAPITFPIFVTGYMSPYPTVLIVATVHHMDAGTLENLPG